MILLNVASSGGDDFVLIVVIVLIVIVVICGTSIWRHHTRGSIVRAGRSIEFDVTHESICHNDELEWGDGMIPY